MTYQPKESIRTKPPKSGSDVEQKETEIVIKIENK